jgi:RHS repeat-associated protein
MSHANSPIGYANPDAVTQIANGLSTTTFTYDNNGNVSQKTADGTTTTYVYDYANRLIALGSQGATTTYGYDAFGQRVFQVGTSTTTLYPFKWYSVASSTGTGAKYATTTEYVFNGDSLVSTVDQQTASGAATGTAQTRFIHPDHLGSTNVVTNASGTVVQTLDYYPYGVTRISANTGGADSARKYIGQFADASNLDYLNARYYDSARGQFLSEDPVVLTLGNPSQLQQLSQQSQRAFLSDPQQFNSYSYGRDNPIINKDPQGNQFCELVCADLVVYPAAAYFVPTIIAGVGTAATYITADMLLRNKGYRYVPFSQQGRQVQLPEVPDPLNPWDGWKPGDPKDWKTWVGAGLGLIGAATEIYQSAKDLPSNNTQTGLPAGTWAPLPPIKISPPNTTPQYGGGSQSASYNAQISSIQAQINSIQAQINAIAQSRTSTSRQQRL